MLKRYDMTEPLTPGQALYLADRLGAEHASTQRIVFNMISNHLFGGIEDMISRPIDRNWRRMPNLEQLIAAAEGGFRRASVLCDEGSLEGLKVTMYRKLREVYHSSVPKLEGIVVDRNLDIAQRVITELMHARMRAVQDVKERSNSFIDKLRGGPKPERVHAEFLGSLSNSDLTAAFSVVAHAIATEAAADAVEPDLAFEMMSDAENLVAEARSLGGSTDPDVWKRLSATEKLISETPLDGRAGSSVISETRYAR